MPFYKKIELSSGSVSIWKIQESVNQLQSLLKLKTPEGIDLKDFKTETQKKQKLAIRLLLYHFFDSYSLNYKLSGKPFLNTPHHISISHSKNYATVMVSDFNCGVDIEIISNRAHSVRNRVFNAQEIKWIANQQFPELASLKIWCAKEAMYKLIDKVIKSIKNQFNVEVNSEKFVGTFTTTNFLKKQFPFDLYQEEEFILMATSEKTS